MNKDATPKLAKLQADFRQHLTQGIPAIESAVLGEYPTGKHPRLAVYRHAYYARLQEALSQDYNAIHTLLGDEAFSELCQRYATRYPSSFTSLRWYGQNISTFLSEEAPYNDHPYLSELAYFEWQLVNTFDAADSNIANITDAARIPAEHWPELRIKLIPSVRWCTYRWNILPVWQAAKDETDMPELTMLPETAHCLIWRQGLTTNFRTLESDEYYLLKDAAREATFSELCERLAELKVAEEEIPVRAAGLLKSWLSQGLVNSLE